MDINELIDVILLELSFRTNEGYPDFKKPEHISLLSEILDEFGLSEIKSDLINNLISEEEKEPFKNPVLNKVIRYKNVAGEDAEGRVGDLIRRPAEEEAHQKAKAELDRMSDEDRKRANDELGTQGQQGRDLDKERETGSDVSTGEESGVEDEVPETGAALSPKTKGGSEYLQNLPVGDPARKNKIVYSVGGGYYSDTPDGIPKYRKVEELLNLSENAITVDTNKGAKNIKVEPIPPDEGKKIKTIIDYDKLSSSDKARIINDRIQIDSEEFTKSEDKIKHTLSSLKKRNDEINNNVILPPGTPASSFAENNGAYYINLIFSKGGNLSKEDENRIISEMSETPLAKLLDEKDRKRWAKIALETAKTEANVLLNIPKYDAKNPQPEGFPQGIIMDRQNKASVERILTYQLETATFDNDDKKIKHYKKQLKFLEKLQKSDTGILYITNDNTLGFKHTSNKSSYLNPHDNTTPTVVIGNLREIMGDTLDPDIENKFDKVLDELSDANKGIQSNVKEFNTSRKLNPKRDIKRENELLAKVLKKFPIRGGDSKDYLYTKEGIVNKPWFKTYAKKQGLSDPVSDNDIMNAVFENAASDNPDTSAQKIILKISEIVENVTDKNISHYADKFGLELDEFIKLKDIADANFKETAASRRDIMKYAHTEIIKSLQGADSKYKGSYPSDPNGDNGPHQTAYVSGYLTRMKFDSYIMGEVSGVASQNIGGDNVEPDYYTECLAKLSDYSGDLTTAEGRSKLVEYLKKRTRISPGGDKIIFYTGEGKSVELGVDKYRTKGDTKAVVASLGSDLQKCLKSRAKR